MASTCSLTLTTKQFAALAADKHMRNHVWIERTVSDDGRRHGAAHLCDNAGCVYLNTADINHMRHIYVFRPTHYTVRYPLSYCDRCEPTRDELREWAERMATDGRIAVDMSPEVAARWFDRQAK